MWYRIAILFLLCERVTLVLPYGTLVTHARISWWIIVVGACTTLTSGLWELSCYLALWSSTEMKRPFGELRNKAELAAYDAAMEDVRKAKNQTTLPDKYQPRSRRDGCTDPALVLALGSVGIIACIVFAVFVTNHVARARVDDASLVPELTVVEVMPPRFQNGYSLPSLYAGKFKIDDHEYVAITAGGVIHHEGCPARHRIL